MLAGHFTDSLFQLVDERVFSINVSSEDIELFQSFLVGLFQLFKFVLLLFTAVLELTTFCVSPLEVCLNSLKLFLFLKEVVSEGLCASLHLVVFTLHFQNSFTALGQLKL